MDVAHLVFDDLKTSTKDVEFKALLIFFLGRVCSDTQNRSVPEYFPESLAEDCIRKIVELQTSHKRAFDEMIEYLKE